MSPRRILLVEDSASLALGICDRLRSEGYEVEVVGDGDLGFAAASSHSFDLLVLDIMLPGRSGFDVCRDLRREGVETPILMLTARGEIVDRVLGLKLGADDYLTKPFDMLELVARVEALLRRAKTLSPEAGEGLRFGEILIDFRKAVVTRGSEVVELSALEYKLLHFFVEHRGELLSRDRLLDEVWGYDSSVYSRTVDQHVAALRRKLEDVPSRPNFILTVHGMGYRFVG